MPLFYYWSLSSLPRKLFPKAIMGQLQDYFHSNDTSSTPDSERHSVLLDLFSEPQIPAIPCKGPVLAASAYGNLALRQFCDLDIP